MAAYSWIRQLQLVNSYREQPAYLKHNSRPSCCIPWIGVSEEGFIDRKSACSIYSWVICLSSVLYRLADKLCVHILFIYFCQVAPLLLPISNSH